MKAQDLKPGQLYRTTPRQRNNRQLQNKIMLTTGPEAGQLLLINADCRQLVLAPTAEVYPPRPTE